MSLFSERLKEAMALRDVSQAELSRAIGKTQGAICNWVSGNRQPSLDNLKEICEYFNIPADYFLGIENYPVMKEISTNDLMTDLSKRDRYIVNSLLKLLSENKERVK